MGDGALRGRRELWCLVALSTLHVFRPSSQLGALPRPLLVPAQVIGHKTRGNEKRQYTQTLQWVSVPRRRSVLIRCPFSLLSYNHNWVILGGESRILPLAAILVLALPDKSYIVVTFLVLYYSTCVIYI